MKSKREFSRSWGKLFLLFIALSVVLIAPVIGFLSVMDGWFIWGKGQYLSQSQGPVYKVGLVDTFTLFVEPELNLDGGVVKASIFAAVALVSLIFGVVLSWMRKGSGQDPGRLFVAVCLVMTFLAASEVVWIHGTLGRNLRFLSDLPFVNHPLEGMIWLACVVAGLILTRYRETILASRGAVGLMVTALALFVAAALNDSSALPLERMSVLLGPVCAIAGLMVLGISQLRTAIVDLRPAAPAAPLFSLFHCEGGAPGVERLTAPSID